MQAINEAAKSEDNNQLLAHAYKLQSACSYCGTVAQKQAAKELEAALRMQQSNIEPLIRSLGQAVHSFLNP